MSLFQTDPAIACLIYSELDRQQNTIGLIASENYVSKSVLEAVGSVLTNKYAEGYPGNRYYAGCEYYDKIETIATDRAKEIFQAEHANVQPHSGSSANLIAYMAAVNPGETILSMNLSHGGHLTHGASVNFSGSLFKIVHYGVDSKTETIDYDRVEFLAKTTRPKLIIAGASAYTRKIDFSKFGEISKKYNAKFLADIAHIAGLVAAGLHQSPVPYADFVTTTTHKTLRGPRGGMILCKSEYKKLIDSKVFPYLQGGPLMHVVAGKAVAFSEALLPSFKVYQSKVVSNAEILANNLKNLGFKLISNGTDNHLILIDLDKSNLKISGKTAEHILALSNIITNKNQIPFDKNSPQITSGIRIGTAAVTSRGMLEPEMNLISTWIVEILRDPNNSTLQFRIKNEVKELAKQFPIFV